MEMIMHGTSSSYKIERVEEFVATVGMCGALDPFSGIERIEEFVATVGMCRALKDIPFAFQTETGTTKDAGVAFKFQMKLLFKEKKFKELAAYMKRKYHALFAMAIRSKKRFQPQLQHFMFDREARKVWVDNQSAKFIAEDFWVRVGSDFTQQSNNWPAQICRGRPCNCFPTD